jgi:hypothetical protein
MPKTVAALALIFELADGGRGAIEAVATARALDWANYLQSHVTRLYSAGSARPYPPARLAHRIDLELMTCVCGHWVGKISFPAPNTCDLSKSAARGSAVG